MELYIQIKNGQPYEHPILGDNFREAFPHVDVNNLPSEFARFERTENPQNAGVKQIDCVRYEFVGDVVKDVWFVRDMTESEIEDTAKALTAGILKNIEQFKILAQERIDDPEIREKGKIAWTEYLNKLSTFVLIDPFNPNLPVWPIVLLSGEVVTTNSSGSVPNVIE